MRKGLAISPFFFGFGLTLTWKVFLSPFTIAGTFGSVMQIGIPLVVILIWGKMSPLRNHRWIVWTTGIAGSIGTLIAAFEAFGSLATLPALAMGAAVITAAAYALFFLLWSELYAELPITLTGVSIAGSYLVGSMLYFLISPLPASVCLGVAVAFPIMSAGALVAGLSTNPAASSIVEDKPTPRETLGKVLTNQAFPWRVIIVVSAFSLAAGFNRSTSTASSDLLSVGIAGLAVLLLIFASTKLSKGITVYRTYRIAFPIMMLSLLAGVVLGGDMPQAKVLIGIGQTVAMITLVMFLCDSSRRFGMNAILLVAIARTCTSVAFFVGGQVAGVSASLIAAAYWEPVIYCLTLIIMVLTTYYWLSGPNRKDMLAEDPPAISLDTATDQPDNRKKTPSRDPLTGRDGEDQTEDPLQSFVEGHSRTLAAEYDLSKRETEVLALLAWGKSAKRIEEILVLSPNTVKTHIRHIYSKLGIHSKAELDILLFGESGGMYQR